MSNYPPNDELNFLLREEPPDTGRWLRAGGGTLAFHLILAVILTNAPLFEGPRSLNEQSEIQPPKVITPLVAPILEPTQKEANKAKLDRSFDVDSLRPKEVVQVPKTAPATPQPAPQAPTQTYIPPAPEQPKPQTQPTPKVPDTPKVQVAENKPAQRPQQGVETQTPIAPQPQIQQQEKPKLSFETPGTASLGNQNGGYIPRPTTTVQEAVKAAARPGRSGGMTVGEGGEGARGLGESANLPKSPNRTSSTLELLSDPEGVDMRPYLIKVLAAIRRNWVAVIPESARFGRPGRVAIQIAISRNGNVDKLVIAMPSGAESLDRAAVAGISASNPLPPLPPEFKGGTIRLQFNFSYNAPR